MTAQKPPKPTLSSLLRVLTKDRLVDVGREFDVAVRASVTKAEQLKTLERSGQLTFDALLPWLRRDELKAACRAHQLDPAGRARATLAARLSAARSTDAAHGTEPAQDAGAAHGAEAAQAAGAARGTRAARPTTTKPPAKPTTRAKPQHPHPPDAAAHATPAPGDIVLCRHRQYLVEAVTPPATPGEQTLVELVCLDDDNQGRRLDVLWELELGARVFHPESQGLGEVDRLDPPRHFAAYLHALKWKAVTATDARLFQAPFRAGIRIKNLQLTPLLRALELPRANLFIADDVGLGKTIEAGLVLQELVLRQKVEFALVVCPASVALQWRDEMQQKFGLHFELVNRAFVARRRQERGFGVNPWSTHNRFIITYQTLRRPEYRDPLLQHIGERIKKSLLILDEAHTAAPASASKYATDSQITRMVRDVAPRFDHRLFLSATPHNGHSNSFSALLELLDPQRFTRGVPVTGAKQLEPIMVRRLKSDLRAIDIDEFPERVVVQIGLRRKGQTWYARARTASDDPDDSAGENANATEGGDLTERPLGEGPAPELELATLLAEYTRLMKPKGRRRRLVFVNLQKRLLSSIEAFHRTLNVHARRLRGERTSQSHLALIAAEEDLEDDYGTEDEALEEALHTKVDAASAELDPPEGQALKLLEVMLDLAARHRGAADAKALALLDWMRRHQCAALEVGDANPDAEPAWSDRRVIVFTEYADTKRYLRQLLTQAAFGTELEDERIMELHGGMSDEGREHVQRAFMSSPAEHPVRILLATDAAREGVNLQAHCADLFHYDVPWNPARLEQRNGRIDRMMQPEPQVRCHYFRYVDRPEDVVLERLVRKVGTIVAELGSVSTVVMDRIDSVMRDGIGERTDELIDASGDGTKSQLQTVARELEAKRRSQETIRAEIDAAGRIYNDSQKVMDFSPDLLRDTLNVALELAGTGPIAPAPANGSNAPEEGLERFSIPDLPDSWARTLDPLRPPIGRDEPFWEWRERPPRPVVFRPLEHTRQDVVQLHLQHPFVQRLLGRFRAQGYSAHELSRVTVVSVPDDAIARVIAFGRLSLYGDGAVRLHDEIVSVAAQWLESGGKGHLRPFADRADQRALERLDTLLQRSPKLKVGQRIRARLASSAAGDFAALWPHIQDEAEHRAHDAKSKLAARGATESEALRTLLEDQRAAIERTLEANLQPALEFGDAEAAERRQFEDDQKHMRERLRQIDGEIISEPEQILALYNVLLERLEPVGLVYLWPVSRG